MIEKIDCRVVRAPSIYSIEFVRDILSHNLDVLCNYLRTLQKRIAIITESNIQSLYGTVLQQKLQENGFDVVLFSFENGEIYKNRETKQYLEDQLLTHKFGKDSCIIALGGGVVSDLAGYIASTYCRGISLVMIPTTLLSMVDSTIGGKNGVNVPCGKNMIGTIYQPNKVYIDCAFIKSLPDSQLKNGIVEMIKHGLICDSLYVEFLEKNAHMILQKDVNVLEKAIFGSCMIKKQIIEEDEQEKGKRVLLNCGHTIGHALEKLTNFMIPHGIAVYIGIITESYIAVLQNYLSVQTFKKIQSIFSLFQIPVHYTFNLSTSDMLDAMMLDKKAEKGAARFVMLKEIGAAVEFQGAYCAKVDSVHLVQAIEWMLYDLCCY